MFSNLALTFYLQAYVYTIKFVGSYKNFMPYVIQYLQQLVQ